MQPNTGSLAFDSDIEFPINDEQITSDCESVSPKQSSSSFVLLLFPSTQVPQTGGPSLSQLLLHRSKAKTCIRLPASKGWITDKTMRLGINKKHSSLSSGMQLKSKNLLL
jgi:hypothetical protein